MTDVRWIGEVAVEGDVAFRIGREGEELVAEWVGLCDLRADRHGERPRFRARPDADPRLIAKVEAGLGAALVRHLRGGISLHASTVALRGGAIAFLGRSGAGKSTLAAYACRERGFELVADDVVAVELVGGGAEAVPTEADHWLDAASRRALGLDASHATKLPVSGSPAARRPVPLRAVVALGAPETEREVQGARTPVTLEPLRGQAALAVLLPCFVRFVIDEPDEQIRELERALALVTTVPVVTLRWRRTFEALPAAVDLIEELLP